MQIQYTGVAHWPTCKKTDSPHIKNAINEIKSALDIFQTGERGDKKQREGHKTMKTRNGMYKFSALYSSDSIKEVVLRFKDAEDLPPEVMQARKRIGSPEDVFTTFKPLFATGLQPKDLLYSPLQPISK